MSIRFNYKKSAVIIFRNSFVKDFTFPSFVMNGESIMEVPFVKYLDHGPFKCYLTLFQGNFTHTHPLVTLITLNLTPL